MTGSEMVVPENRRRLMRLLAGPPEKADLAEGALLIAAEVYPKMKIRENLDKIQDLASEVRPLSSSSLPDSARRLSEVLHDRHGFKGDEDGFNNPECSFLNKVLARKQGLPILLSIIYMSVAKRCGLDCQGVSLPGHFVVRLARRGEASVITDPFHGGRILQESRRSLRQRGAGEEKGSSAGIGGPSPTMILTRLLNNLKRIYLLMNSFDNARWVLELILLVNVGLIPPLRFESDSDNLDKSLLETGRDFERISPKIHRVPMGGRFVADLSLLNRIRVALN